MLLAYNLAKIFRPQPVGQRPPGRSLFRFVNAEQIGHALLLVWSAIPSDRAQ
jgi:hypothetical protein